MEILNYVKTKSYVPLFDYKAIKEQARINSYFLLKLWLLNRIIKAHEYIAFNPFVKSFFQHIYLIMMGVSSPDQMS